MLPAYHPLDERLPADLDDPYPLSKFTDERTAEMASRHWGIDVVTLRFPLTAAQDSLVEHARTATEGPRQAAKEGWSYLDALDGARAVELSLPTTASGAHPWPRTPL